MSDCVCQWTEIDGFFEITRETLIFCEPPDSAFLVAVYVTGWRSGGYITFNIIGMNFG